MIVSSGENQQFLRKLQTIIIFTKRNKTSYGYFTADGNLILEHMMKRQIL
jgi:hypothetical protein